MKQFYQFFILSVFGITPILSQEYTPLANPDHQWKVNYTMNFMAPEPCVGLEMNHIYFLGEPVEIQGNNYYELWKTYEDGALETWNTILDNCPNEVGFATGLEGLTELEDILVGYIRDDVQEKKVYFLKNENANEVLIYDFSLNQGDEYNGYTLVSKTEVEEFGLNTTRYKFSFQGSSPFYFYEQIGVNGDLILKLPSSTFMEGGGFTLTAFSTDNGTTFFDKQNNLLSTHEIQTENSVKIYPNPARDLINIQSTKKIESVLIYDLSGKLLKKSSTHKVNLDGLKTGNYIVLVQLKDNSKHQFNLIKK